MQRKRLLAKLLKPIARSMAGHPRSFSYTGASDSPMKSGKAFVLQFQTKQKSSLVYAFEQPRTSGFSARTLKYLCCEARPSQCQIARATFGRPDTFHACER